MRTPRALLLCLLLTTVAAAPGWARAQAAATASVVEEAAAALARDPVYVHPQADPGLSDADADRLRREIVRAEAGPLYVAPRKREPKPAGAWPTCSRRWPRRQDDPGPTP